MTQDEREQIYQTLDPEQRESIEKLEEFIDGLEDQIEDLREENSILHRQLAISSPQNVKTLKYSLTEYLDWVDSPNTSMSGRTVEMIHTQLRSALDDAIRELR